MGTGCCILIPSCLQLEEFEQNPTPTDPWKLPSSWAAVESRTKVLSHLNTHPFRSESFTIPMKLLFVSVPSPPWICEQSDYFGKGLFSQACCRWTTAVGTRLPYITCHLYRFHDRSFSFAAWFEEVGRSWFWAGEHRASTSVRWISRIPR